MHAGTASAPARLQTPSATRILVASGLGLLFDAMDVSLISFVLVVLGKEWSLSPVWSGVLGSMGFAGMAVGSALAGLLADHFGRRRVFIWTLLVYSIATGLTAFAPGVAIFLVLRFLVGLGLGGELPVATTYVNESSPDAVRGRRVVLLEAFWAGGSLVAAILSRIVIPSIGWRYVFLFGALPALYAIVIRYALPETPKFSQVMRKAHMRTALRTLFARPFLRATAVTWVLWFIMNFCYYGISLWLPSLLAKQGYSVVTSLSYVLIMILAQIPGYLTAAWLVERWGRKKTLVSAMLLTAFAAVGFGFAPSTAWLIVFGLLVNYFMLAAFAGTYVFTVEQFPVRARASGIGWASGFGRIAGIIAPSFVGLLVAAHATFAAIFLCFCCAMLVGFAVVAWAGRETKGRLVD
ncbi:MFS transporter [Alicyclobacillus cellulosilyticus]|uniref:MFS transporter n=1 Tax=Alicyclobacillus cellulosilyticus TaxID=1003997 RepID=A0A917NPV3_9BACL|nr:MFS transporter [Alicyclobacillus cellulosilyticus]GGJ13866.1 MFS transporter [Alicyclobacillus cellulosilyticus]